MNSDDDDVTIQKLDLEFIPGSELTTIVDVRPNAITRGILFSWRGRYLMTVQDSNIDYMAADWKLENAIMLPEPMSPVQCVGALFSWATVCIFDPVEAGKYLATLTPDEDTELVPPPAPALMN